MLSIERSGYYSWLKHKPGKREISNAELDQKTMALNALLMSLKKIMKNAEKSVLQKG